VRDTFGKRAVIQRCQFHKMRNVLGSLPPSWHPEATRRLRAAWGLTRWQDAHTQLERVVRWLRTISEPAAASLEEGLAETITVDRLGLTGALRATCRSANPIDSAFDVVRAHARRVKRWRHATMVMRWAASGLVQAERRFHHIKGHAQIPDLVQAFEDDDLHPAKVAA